MTTNRIKAKGILAKLLEQGLKILLIKECRKISNLKVNIISSSTQIIKGEIQQLNIIAEDINYKDLLFDKAKLEANNLNINLSNKQLYLKNNPIIKIKVSLSQISLKTVLLSRNWNWIGSIISKGILNQDKLEDIKIKNDELLIKASEKNNNVLEEETLINISAKNGKIYLKNKANNMNIHIPIEDKIYIKNVSIENNLINISANSSISL